MEKGSFSYRLGAWSQFINAFIGKGNRDQTFSARSWEAEDTLKSRRWFLIRSTLDKLFFWEPQHCFNSFLTDNEFTYKD